MTLAKIFVTGKIVKAPEKRFTQNDLPILGFTIDADSTEETLIRVSVIGAQADNLEKILSAGDNVLVDGRLQTNTFKTQNGKDKKVFEINASTVEKISAHAPSSTPQATAKSESLVQFSDDDMSDDLINEDEIPF